MKYLNGATKINYIQQNNNIYEAHFYNTLLTVVSHIDLLEAPREKFAKVEEKYPLNKSLALAKTLRES